MGFRFRRRIGPKGLKINLTKNGFSSISIGGKGITANAPLGRKGGVKYTAGIPGSGLSWDQEEKDASGGGSIDGDCVSTAVRPSVSNWLVAIVVVAAPILLLWGCVASLQNAGIEAEKKEAAAQARIRNEDRAVLRQLVASNARMWDWNDGLAQVIFWVTNNSNRRICNLSASITYTTAAGKRQSTSERLLRGDSCIGPGGPNEFTVTLVNRKLRGAMVGSTPKVRLVMPPGGLSGTWKY